MANKLQDKRGIILIQVTRDKFEALGEAGILVSSKANKNYYIASKHKKSRRHKYYVVESRKILEFLNNYKDD